MIDTKILTESEELLVNGKENREQGVIDTKILTESENRKNY